MYECLFVEDSIKYAVYEVYVKATLVTAQHCAIDQATNCVA